MSELKPTIWHGCYDASWKGVITGKSFSHPAKFARGLIGRIYIHCLERGYVRKGDTVGKVPRSIRSRSQGDNLRQKSPA